MTRQLDLLDRFEPISLREVNEFAKLQTRKDRKYVLSATQLAQFLGALPLETQVMKIDGRVWSGYRSVYFDTPELDSYRLAATRRPQRFKARTRTYIDSGLEMVEVKTKSRRNTTVKHRRRLDPLADSTTSVIEFAGGIHEAAPYADRLEPLIVSEYRRATLAMPSEGVRVTIDAGFVCTNTHGASIRLIDAFIVETKSGGSPSSADRILWASGQRPVKISKFATGLAALRPELSSNRWNRVLRRHFNPASTSTPHNRSLVGAPA